MNGLEIAYERVGQGPPLLFVHGAAQDARGWKPQLAGLADEFTVVAWDEPGAGRSSDVPPDFSLVDYANGLAALIDAVGLGPAHVAGLSWGGTVVQELYRHHPELVATLIFVDTYAGWKGSLPEAEVRARVAGAQAMLAAHRQRSSTRRFPACSPASRRAEYVPLLEAIATAVRPETLRTQLSLMAEADQRDLLPRHRRADAAALGRARRALAAQRRTPVRTGDPGRGARRDPRLRPRQQPRAARPVQRGDPRVLPRASSASDVNAPSGYDRCRSSSAKRRSRLSTVWRAARSTARPTSRRSNSPFGPFRRSRSTTRS